jgi:transcriptional regulator with XRE-family HTH domain/Zn-dependent peptidase ImmA (M78 family)
MAHMDNESLGRRIREEREHGALTQSQLAGLAGLDRTAIAKVESGARRVTALELLRLADALQVRMASFFDQPVPALVSHRSHGGLDVMDSKIDELLGSLAEEVEFVQRLSGDLGGFEHALEPASLGSDAEAESLATSARAQLGLDGEEPAVRLDERVSRIGLWAFARELGNDTADAGTILLRRGGVSLVNSSNKVGRRRLALAHELGHYLVQDEYTIDWRVASGDGSETRMDRFARALLLPGDGFRGFWSDNIAVRSVRDAAVMAGSRYQVDMATLARRVAELDLTGDVGEIRMARTAKADIVEWGLSPSFEMEGTSLPIGFQKTVLRLLRDERISRERALELLQGSFDESDLPVPRTRTEGERWNLFA